MIFIDVEGYEVRVIRGARSLLSLHSPDLVVEANPDCLQVFGFSLEELRDELAGLGYSIAAIGTLGLHEPSTDTFPGYQNWLCVEDASRLGIVHRLIRKSALLPCVPPIHPLTRPRSRNGY